VAYAALLAIIPLKSIELSALLQFITFEIVLKRARKKSSEHCFSWKPKVVAKYVILVTSPHRENFSVVLCVLGFFFVCRGFKFFFLF